MFTDKDLNEAPPLFTAVSSKLKAIRGKFRKAVNEGRRSGNGRVVTLHFDLLNEIWGGSPATEPGVGVETEVQPSQEAPASVSENTTPLSSRTATPSSSNANEVVTPTGLAVTTDTLDNRRALLGDKLSNYKASKMKRKLSADQQMVNAQKEDTDVKKNWWSRSTP